MSQRVEADEVVMDLQVQLKRSKGALAGEESDKGGAESAHGPEGGVRS